MKTLEIVKEEFKKSGLEVAEEVAEKVTCVLFDKVIPRLAVEAEEQGIKSACFFISPIAPVIKSELLKLEDKIDGKIGE